MRLLIVCGSVSMLVLACTVEHTELTQGDATRAYVAPMFCKKQSACEPVAFAAAYPGGIEECKTRFLERVQKDADFKEGELTKCTNGDFQKCRDDFEAQQCPTDPKAGGAPPFPASCTKC